MVTLCVFREFKYLRDFDCMNRYTARGLYEEHKLLFTLLLALKIDLQEGKLKQSEFQTLIKGGVETQLQPYPSLLQVTDRNLITEVFTPRSSGYCVLV